MQIPKKQPIGSQSDFASVLLVNVELTGWRLLFYFTLEPAVYGPGTPVSLAASPSLLTLLLSTLFQELLPHLLSWSGLLCQHVSFPSSGSPRYSAVHCYFTSSLVLKHGLLPPCISTYRSQRTFSQGFSSRYALHTITFLLLG